jgi:hypothetical protein
MSHTVELLGSQWTYKLGISLNQLYNENKRYVCVCTSILGVYKQK